MQWRYQGETAGRKNTQFSGDTSLGDFEDSTFFALWAKQECFYTILAQILVIYGDQ